MARFTRESVDRVKEAVDIVEIVSPYTDLQQRGQDYWGNCPFHDERTPSFKVNPRDKLYYCFGCEASGDVFRFVEEKEGLDFRDAVESLARAYGVELEREDEDPQGRGAAAAEGAAVGAAGADGEVLRALPVGVAEGGEGAGLPGRAGAGGGGAAALRRGDGAERRGTRC